MRDSRHAAAGVVLHEADQPDLWAEVRRLAQSTGARVPDEIDVVAEAEVTVVEETVLLGLRGATRRLIIGLPVMLWLTIDQLRAVVVAELALDRRARQAQGRPAADERSAEAVGAPLAVSGLRAFDASTAAWAYFLDSYAALGQSRGERPRELFDGFAAFVEVRREEFAAVAQRSSPATATRIAALAASVHQRPRPTTDGGLPAAALLRDPDSVAGQLERQLYDGTGLMPVAWDTLVADAMAGHVERVSRWALQAMAAYGVRPATLRGLLETVRTTGTATLQAAFGIDDRARFEEVVGDVIAHALVKAGQARHRIDWAGPPGLTTPEGTTLDVPALVGLALGDPATVKLVLLQHGVDIDERSAVPQLTR